VTKKGVRYARFKASDGQTVMAPLLTKDESRCRVKAAKWYGQYRDADGILRRVPLSENRTAAQQMLNALVRKAELGKVGIVDPFEEHSRRPLREHLADFEASLKADSVSAKQVRQVVTRARRVIDGCKFAFIAELSASCVQQFLADLRTRKALPPLDTGKAEFTLSEAAQALSVSKIAIAPMIRRHGLEAVGQGRARRYPRATVEALRERLSQGMSVQTGNFYLAAVKQFARWLRRDRRMNDNPLAHLEGGNVKLDRRHDRQTLSEKQLCLLLDATLASCRVHRGLSGIDRHALYMTACYTGFRASEIASLMPESFDLDGDPPTATVPSAYTKNRQLAVQPLAPDVVDVLREYLPDKEPGKPVWPGRWALDAAEMLRPDLDEAGIAYVTDGPDGPLYADFHSLRHSYVALLERTGASLKQAMQLARHSDPRLTMARYGRAHLSDLGTTVQRMPSLAPRPAQAQALAL
jgi:excisionase family DNA binding protein